MSFVLSGLYGENILTYRVDNVDNIILTFYFCEVRPLFLSTLTLFLSTYLFMVVAYTQLLNIVLGQNQCHYIDTSVLIKLSIIK